MRSFLCMHLQSLGYCRASVCCLSIVSCWVVMVQQMALVSSHRPFCAHVREMFGPCQSVRNSNGHRIWQKWLFDSVPLAIQPLHLFGLLLLGAIMPSTTALRSAQSVSARSGAKLSAERIWARPTRRSQPEPGLTTQRPPRLFSCSARRPRGLDGWTRWMADKRERGRVWFLSSALFMFVQFLLLPLFPCISPSLSAILSPLFRIASKHSIIRIIRDDAGSAGIGHPPKNTRFWTPHGDATTILENHLN